MALVTVGRVEEFPEGEARKVEVDGREIALANLGDGQFRAIDDICSHAHAHLHEGEVDADLETIECPRHGSTFDLESGRPRSLPAIQALRIYPVKVEDDEIRVEIDDG